MSPKADSEIKVLTRTAWSRDVRPNTPGVTYSRRSYYYDREFSDSIIRPTDGFESFPSERSAARRSQEQAYGLNKGYENTFPSPSAIRSKCFQSGGRRSKGQFEDTITRPRDPSDWRFDDPFTIGRVLQSASADDHGDDDAVTHELQNIPPPEPVQPQVQAELDLKWSFPGLDRQTIAQGIVMGMDIAVRLAEAYQRVRDGDGEDEGADDEFFGIAIEDPYHLEAGPPRRLRPLSRALPRRSFLAPKTTTKTAVAKEDPATDGIQGDTSCQSNSATAPRSLLPPLPAGKRVCYYLLATVVFGVLMSFGLALWWAQSQGDVSAGFTIGGYVIAVDALVVAVVGVVHRPGCRCWKA
ncbi:hypothetical protein F4859DRAFT_471940 [Xylaria cf. heliscus]|nr:hypothetical protein F4859DRAFT_471940 [Xylaria cf. heliscus]